MGTVNVLWFKKQLSEIGISQRQLAKKLELDPASITLFFQGKRKLKSSEAAFLANLFGVEVSEVLEQAGIVVSTPPNALKIPLVGSVGEELVITWNTAKNPPTVKISGFDGVGLKALRFETAGTAFDGLDGALAVFKKNTGGIDSEALGRLAIVTLKDGRSLIRVLRRGYMAGRFNLATISGDSRETGVEIVAANPILGLKL